MASISAAQSPFPKWCGVSNEIRSAALPSLAAILIYSLTTANLDCCLSKLVTDFLESLFYQSFHCYSFLIVKLNVHVGYAYKIHVHVICSVVNRRNVTEEYKEHVRMRHHDNRCKGPPIKYVTLFLTNFDPRLSDTLCHLMQNPRKYVTLWNLKIPSDNFVRSALSISCIVLYC